MSDANQRTREWRFYVNDMIEKATVAKIATVQVEGARQVAREIEYYNLDVILKNSSKTMGHGDNP